MPVSVGSENYQTEVEDPKQDQRPEGSRPRVPTVSLLVHDVAIARF